MRREGCLPNDDYRIMRVKMSKLLRGALKKTKFGCPIIKNLQEIQVIFRRHGVNVSDSYVRIMLNGPMRIGKHNIDKVTRGIKTFYFFPRNQDPKGYIRLGNPKSFR